MLKVLNITGANLGRWLLLMANYSALFFGSITSRLLSRFYFIHGGSNRWVSTWVQCAGFPLLLPVICLSLRWNHRPFSGLSRHLLLLSLLVGVFLGVNNFLISWGVSYLPVSTSSLLMASQLAFNLVLSVLLVRQKVCFTNLNCVVLLTISSVLLALGANSDRPPDTSEGEFFTGFLSILGAALMFALYLPLMERIYRGVYGFWTVVEMQMLVELAATAFATMGMVATGGFRDMRREADELFDLGRGAYWATLWSTVVAWQLVFMGMAGMVFLTSSLNSGICSTALTSMTVVGGVVVFKDNFGGLKAMSMVLCIWGFTSYLFGEYKRKEEGEGGGDMETESVGGGGERI